MLIGRSARSAFSQILMAIMGFGRIDKERFNSTENGLIRCNKDRIGVERLGSMQNGLIRRRTVDPDNKAGKTIARVGC